jgi:hypothetical protein
VLGISALAAAQFGLSGPGSQLGMPQYMRAETKPIVELQNNEGIYVNKANVWRAHGQAEGFRNDRSPQKCRA